MSRGRWFLPETPDVLGLLRQQAAVTLDGLDAFQRWAGGDAGAAEAVRGSERHADDAKRAVLGALRAAFVTPLEPEDLFALSRGVDRILGYARDVVAESEAMASPPDEVIADMAALLVEAVRDIDRALSISAPTTTRRPTPPRRRSGPTEASSAPTTRAWGRCSTSRTAASESRGGSSIAAASGSARS